MSAIERLVLWLHVAFVIFTIGPVTIAIMSSPRAIRTGNAVVLQHLLVMTRIFGTASLGVLAAPVVGVVGSVLALGERPSIHDAIGFVLILAAAACVLLAPTAGPPRAAPIGRK